MASAAYAIAESARKNGDTVKAIKKVKIINRDKNSITPIGPIITIATNDFPQKKETALSFLKKNKRIISKTVKNFVVFILKTFV